MTTWYAIRTRAQRELTTAEDLRKAGHTVFVPVEILVRRSRHTKTAKEIIRPIVASYVFVEDQPWHTHKHVLGAVLMGGEPVRIGDDAMRPLFLASGRTVATQAPPRALRIGDVVEVAIGPLAGKSVTIGRLIKGKIEVVTTMLGSPRTVTIDKSALAA